MKIVETCQPYIHKVIDLVHVYENLTCSISTRLYSAGKTWKMDINGPGESWKCMQEGHRK